MPDFQRAILTHGGAGSDPKDSDGPKSAAIRGMDLMVDGGTALTAVVDAVKYLEDDPQSNAGSGAKLRIDGRTMQLDASCMTSNNEFGAVACVENIKNPIDLAHGVLRHSPHILLAGDVPLPGCGLFCGSSGAVACTGDGEFIALKLLAKTVYTWLENSMSPDEAAHKAIHLFDPRVDIGLIILTRNGFASNARNGMPWSHMTENKPQ